jgi:hypothetical protein
MQNDFDWALVNEPEIQRLLDRHIEAVVGNSSATPIEYEINLQSEAIELTGAVYQTSPLQGSLLNIHDAELFFHDSSANKDGYQVIGDIVADNVTVKSSLKVSGSKFLFENNKVTVASTSQEEAALSITLSDPGDGSNCFFKIAPEVTLTVIGKLEINIEHLCNIIIAGTLEASTIQINSLSGSQLLNTASPKISILEGGKILSPQEISTISGVGIVNYGSANLSNFKLTSIRTFENHGNLEMSATNACSTHFFNAENSILVLKSGTSLLVKNSFINFGLLGITEEALILNSYICNKKVIEQTKSIGYTSAQGGGVFYNKGIVLTTESNHLLQISSFQLVANGLLAEINARLNIHTIYQSSGYDAILNLGGRIYIQNDSILTTFIIMNYPLGPKIQDAPGYIVFQGSSNLDIENGIYNIESYFGGKDGDIKFIKPLKNINCVAQTKSCIFEGKFTGAGKLTARDISKKSTIVSGKLITVPIEDDRVKSLSSSKAIPLHEMSSDWDLQLFDLFKPRQKEASPSSTLFEDKDKVCLKQFYYVNEVHKNMPDYYLGLADQLCKLDFQTSYRKPILYNGNQLERFLQKYEKLIFGFPLDREFQSPSEKMNILIMSGVEEKKRNPSLEILKPFPDNFSPQFIMLWAVEVQNKQGTNIIVPYLYIPQKFKKDERLVVTKFLSGSQFLLTMGSSIVSSTLIAEGGGIKAIADKKTEPSGVTFEGDLNIPGGSTVELEGYLYVTGSIINKGVINSIGFSLLEAKERIVHLGQITGENLLLRAKVLMIEILVGNAFSTEYSKQLMLATQDPEFRVLDKKTQTWVRPTVDLSGVFIIEVEDIAKIEAAKIKAKQIGIKSQGKIFVIPIGLYERVSHWWGSGSLSKESLDFLTTELQAEQIQIISEDDACILSTTFIGDAMIRSQKHLILDVVSKVELTKKIEHSTKKSWFGLKKKITTRQELIQIAEPIFNHFLGDITLQGEEGVKLVGLNVDNAKNNRITAGTKEKEALVEIMPATKVVVYDINTRSKKTFLCFKIGGSHSQERGLLQHSIINVVKSDNGFYGYSHGNWLQLATHVESNEIYIGARREVIIADAHDVFYIESHLKKAGFATWFDAGAQGVSIGAGFRYKETHITNREVISVPSVFIAKHTEIESETGLAYLVGIFNTETLKIKADKIDFGIGKNSKYISASSLFYQIGINFGVKFGPGAAIKSIENLANQNTDSTIGTVNTAFAAVQAYTAVSELTAAIATGGISALFSAGAWISFNMESSKEKIEQKTITPTIINARHIVCEAREISMKATQIFAFDAYFKAQKLNIDPGEVSFKRDSSGQSFGFSLGVDLSNIFGEKIANQIGGILDKLKTGRLPVGDILPSFTLGGQDGNQVRHMPTRIHVSDKLEIIVDVEATIRGADIVGKSLFANFNKLILKSVQDIIKNKEWAASVGVSNNVVNILSNFAGKYQKEDGLLVDEITRLVGTEVATVVVASALHLHGAMIANAEIDEHGQYTDKGKLTLDVGDLFVKHLHNHDNGMIVGAAYEFLNKQMGANKGESNGSGGILEEKIRVSKTGYNFKPEFGYKAKDGKAFATIGRGNAYIRGMTQGDELNRDLNAANTLGGDPAKLESIKGFFSSETPSLREFSDNFISAATRLSNELGDIGKAFDGWLGKLSKVIKLKAKHPEPLSFEEFKERKREEAISKINYAQYVKYLAGYDGLDLPPESELRQKYEAQQCMLTQERMRELSKEFGWELEDQETSLPPFFKNYEGQCSSYPGTYESLVKNTQTPTTTKSGLTVPESFQLAKGAYEEDIERGLRNARVKNTKVIEVFDHGGARSYIAITTLPDGRKIKTYNIAGTASIKDEGWIEFLKDLPNNIALISGGRLVGHTISGIVDGIKDIGRGDSPRAPVKGWDQISDRMSWHIKNMEKYYTYEDETIQFVLNGFSAGGGDSTILTTLRPELVSEVNAFDPPGTKAPVTAISKNDQDILNKVREKITIYPGDPNIVNTAGEHIDGVKMLYVPVRGHNAEAMGVAINKYGVSEINSKFYNTDGFVDKQGNYYISRPSTTTIEHVAKEFELSLDRIEDVSTQRESRINDPFGRLPITFKIKLRPNGEG